ncbi:MULTISPECIES: superoxide dismutase, Ni [Marinobacter]|uniref:superoxide dismutase, Ni n=1 Tax=Marinobacter TaxID=2742 RepID=UPI000DABA334|nr:MULTISPECIES: superoxide dismutase, Ni [Marinobacter]
MLSKLTAWYDRAFGVDTVAAHCDIPCKIYDPISAQIAALSVLRFMDLIGEMEGKDSLTVADHAQLARLVREKEDHAEKAKHEVRVIWGDYFKQPQFDQYPDASSLVHSIMLAGSACKQGIEREKGEKLLELINEFADAFWTTKGVSTFKATCPYPPNETVVYPKLN